MATRAMTEREKELAEANLPLVGFILKRHMYGEIRPDEYDDWLQIGCIGLCRAAMAFDETKGVQFGTFAYQAIIHAFHLEIRRRRCRIRIPAEKVESIDVIVDGEEFDRNEVFPDVAQDFVDGLMDKIMLEELSDDDKQIVRLSADGYTQREIGKIIGTSQTAVNKRMRRIKAKCFRK